MAKLNCEYVKNRIDDFLDETLSPEDNSVIGAHINECASCGAEYKFRKTVRDACRQIDSEACETPYGFHDALMASLRNDAAKKKKTPNWLFGWPGPYKIAAALALSLFIAFMASLAIINPFQNAGILYVARDNGKPEKGVAGQIAGSDAQEEAAADGSAAASETTEPMTIAATTVAETTAASFALEAADSPIASDDDIDAITDANAAATEGNAAIAAFTTAAAIKIQLNEETSGSIDDIEKSANKGEGRSAFISADNSKETAEDGRSNANEIVAAGKSGIDEYADAEAEAGAYEIAASDSAETDKVASAQDAVTAPAAPGSNAGKAAETGRTDPGETAKSGGSGAGITVENQFATGSQKNDTATAPKPDSASAPEPPKSGADAGAGKGAGTGTGEAGKSDSPATATAPDAAAPMPDTAAAPTPAPPAAAAPTPTPAPPAAIAPTPVPPAAAAPTPAPPAAATPTPAPPAAGTTGTGTAEGPEAGSPPPDAGAGEVTACAYYFYDYEANWIENESAIVDISNRSSGNVSRIDSNEESIKWEITVSARNTAQLLRALGRKFDLKAETALQTDGADEINVTIITLTQYIIK